MNSFVCRDNTGCALGTAEVDTLEWGTPEGLQAAVRLSNPPLDMVLACDCCYEDPRGPTPDPSEFAKAAHALCTPQTRCLITFETRSDTLRELLLANLHAHFRCVTEVSRTHIPEAFRVDHIEVYELRL